MTTIGEMGEFGLIEQLVARLGPARADTVVGAGPDDTAVLRLPSGRLQLATIDTQVGGTHFSLEGSDGYAVGRKLAAVNLSDIAAMGGTPTHALATLSAPAALPAKWALDFVDGISSELSRWGADLVGGNMSRHDGVVVDLALLGEVDEEVLLLRSGAQPGDVLMVTGDLGGAGVGLLAQRLLDTGGGDELHLDDEHLDLVLARLRVPQPRVGVGRLLRPLGATAALDVSDGLAGDVAHLCSGSGVGVRIDAERLPIQDATREVARRLEVDPLEVAVAAGEDYELLLAVAADGADGLAEHVLAETGVAVTAIGVVTEATDRVLVLQDGSERGLEGGWRHFGGGSDR